MSALGRIAARLLALALPVSNAPAPLVPAGGTTHKGDHL